MQNSPPINLPKSLSLIWQEKFPSILYGPRHYALAPLENRMGLYPSIFARKCRIKLANILNLTKSIVRQNRSVGSCIIQQLKCFQLKPLKIFHWDFCGENKNLAGGGGSLGGVSGGGGGVSEFLAGGGGGGAPPHPQHRKPYTYIYIYIYIYILYICIY